MGWFDTFKIFSHLFLSFVNVDWAEYEILAQRTPLYDLGLVSWKRRILLALLCVRRLRQTPVSNRDGLV
jgi:hypothetical protein